MIGLPTVEGGKFVGTTAIGAAAGWAGGVAAFPICVAIGVSTAGLGGVVCVAAIVGTSAWVGAAAGSAAGEEIGEILYEKTLP